MHLISVECSTQLLVYFILCIIGRLPNLSSLQHHLNNQISINCKQIHTGNTNSITYTFKILFTNTVTISFAPVTRRTRMDMTLHFTLIKEFFFFFKFSVSEFAV